MLRRLCVKKPVISLLQKPKLPKISNTINRYCVTTTSTVRSGGNVVSSLLHRTAFVGVSVGIATPALIPVGVATMWLRMLPRQSSFIRLGVYVLVGGGLMPLLYHYVLPFLQNYSDVIMPFALANGVTSSALYGFSELLYGLNLFKHQILGISVVGPVVGMGTAILAPLLWPVLCKICWNNDLQSIMFKNSNVFNFMDLYYEFLLVPVTLPLGFFSGIALGNILTPIMLGATQNMNIATVAASTVAFCYFYIYRAGSDDYYYEVRIDPVTQKRSSYNVLNSKVSTEDGGYNGNLSQHRRNTVYIISKITEFPRFFLNPYIASRMMDNNVVTSSSMDNMYIRDEIIPLIDTLLRTKYKMMNNGDTSVTNYESDRYRYLDKMFGYIEVAIALRKQGDVNSKEQIDKIKGKIVSECIKNTSQKSFTEQLQYREPETEIEKLFDNLDLIESELKTRLKYEVDLSVIDKHKKQEQYNQVYTYGTITASIVTIVSFINYLFL